MCSLPSRRAFSCLYFYAVSSALSLAALQHPKTSATGQPEWVVERGQTGEALRSS